MKTEGLPEWLLRAFVSKGLKRFSQACSETCSFDGARTSVSTFHAFWGTEQFSAEESFRPEDKQHFNIVP